MKLDEYLDSTRRWNEVRSHDDGFPSFHFTPTGHFHFLADADFSLAEIFHYVSASIFFTARLVFANVSNRSRHHIQLSVSLMVPYETLAPVFVVRSGGGAEDGIQEAY